MSTFAMASVTAETQVPLYTYQKGANPEHTLYKLNDRQPIWKETEAKPLRPVAFPLQTSTDFLPMTVYFRHNGDFNADKLRMVASFDGDRVFRSDWFKLSGSGATFVDRWYFYFNTIGPLQFRGDFTWHIEGENGWLVATAESRTELEVYSIINWQRAGPVVAKLWSPHGVSANFMRAHVPKFTKSRQDWPLARYYNDIVQSVFDTPLKYDTYAGNAHFSTCYDDGSAGLLNVDLYTTVLESAVAHQALVNCYDLTGMIKVTLSLLPEFQAVHTYRLDPFGFIKSTTLKGYKGIKCNNPLFNHGHYSAHIEAAQNYEADEKFRGAFSSHIFIHMAIPPSQYPVVLDATMGPYGGHHVPARSLLAYLVSAVDTPADTDLYEVTGERVGLESEAWKVTGITLTSPEEYANLAPGNKAHALGPAAPPANKTDEHLRAAISRAEVPNADPPRYQQIDVDGIAKLVASTAQLELQGPITFVPGLSMSSLSFDLADPKRPSPIFPALRVSLTLASFFSGALTAMRAAIVPTDARMQDSFIKAAAPAGQYALQYTDGNTYMFVRGDCYVELHGDREVTMETLGAVAQALDKNFKTREVADRAAISCPAVDDVMAPKTPVCLGMEFGVTLRVQNAKDATVHAVCDIIVVQLLEVRTVDVSAGQMEVRLRANGVGRTRVELFVADRATMGVSTAFVDLEVDG